MGESTSVVVGVLVAMYSAAAHLPRNRARLAGAIAAVALISSAIALGKGLGDLAFVAAMFAAVWATGRTIRARRSTESALKQHAFELERQQEERARAAAAEERVRIARELHDVVAHSVSTIVVQAAAERRVLDPEQTSARETLAAIETTGRQALAEMRRLLGMLRQGDEDLALSPQPTLRNATTLVEHVRRSGLPVELAIEGDPVTLPPGVDLSAYRIIQEALTNALKHAGPARARVSIRYSEQEVELEITDDGRGRAAETDGNGHGLVGMRERASLYGGDLEAGESSAGGYAVRARLPFDNPRA